MKQACLPMYDLPCVQAATEAWWLGLAAALLRQGFSDVPETLEQGSSAVELVRQGRLLLGQCCGYDLIRNAEALAPVATPVYGTPHCRGPFYRSLIIVAESDEARSLADLRDRICAINSPASHSGYTALRLAVAPLARSGRFFSSIVETGAHAESLDWVRSGRADCSSVDCVTYALLAKHRPDRIRELRILAESEPAPGLPYVTSTATGPAELAGLRAALQEAATAEGLAHPREDLLIEGFEVLPAPAYERIREMEVAADSLGYPIVH